MKITVEYTRGGFEENFQNLPLELKLYTNDNVLHYSKVVAEKKGEFSFDAVIPRSLVFFSVSTVEPNVFHCPVIISALKFDNFYCLKTFAHHGMPVPLIANDNIEITPGNCLFFCGSLVYTWQGPVPQIIFPSTFRFANPK